MVRRHWSIQEAGVAQQAPEYKPVEKRPGFTSSLGSVGSQSRRRKRSHNSSMEWSGRDEESYKRASGRTERMENMPWHWPCEGPENLSRVRWGEGGHRI